MTARPTSAESGAASDSLQSLGEDHVKAGDPGKWPNNDALHNASVLRRLIRGRRIRISGFFGRCHKVADSVRGVEVWAECQDKNFWVKTRSVDNQTREE